jgi:hypothetical protein
MKFAKSILMGTGGVVLAGLILTLLAPKAAHAIVATAVSVVNTSSNPVPVSSIDGPGRVPFIESGSFECNLLAYCLSAFTTPVPAGHRVVITYMSGSMNFVSTPTYAAVALNTTLNSTIIGPVEFNVPVINPAGVLTIFGAPVTYYFDAGQIPSVDAFSYNGIFRNGLGLQVTLVGYELDCTVAPCPAVAIQ